MSACSFLEKIKIDAQFVRVGMSRKNIDIMYRLYVFVSEGEGRGGVGEGRGRGWGGVGEGLGRGGEGLGRGWGGVGEGLGRGEITTVKRHTFAACKFSVFIDWAGSR